MGRNAGQLQSLDRGGWRKELRLFGPYSLKTIVTCTISPCLHYPSREDGEESGATEIFESISRAVDVTVEGIYLYCAEEESQDT